MTANTVIPSLPRFSSVPASDDPVADLAALRADFDQLVEYLQTFVNAAVSESHLLDPSFQADGTIDVNNPPDPADSSIGKAQATANAALSRAQSAQDRADAAYDLAQSLVP